MFKLKKKSKKIDPTQVFFTFSKGLYKVYKIVDDKVWIAWNEGDRIGSNKGNMNLSHYHYALERGTYKIINLDKVLVHKDYSTELLIFNEIDEF